jgi:GTP-binding protein
MNNLVAIVGRPNVGKSTLFNRLTETQDAITDPTSGTTRDRKYGKATWIGRTFNVIDTGGWITKSDDAFESAIRAQVAISIEEAHLIMFVVDTQNGVTDIDADIAHMLRRSKKPVMVVCNKVDTSMHEGNTSDFYFSFEWLWNGRVAGCAGGEVAGGAGAGGDGNSSDCHCGSAKRGEEHPHQHVSR